MDSSLTSLETRLLAAIPLSSDIPRRPNPFYYAGRINPYEAFKLSLGIVIAPLRVLLVLTLVLIAWCFAKLSISFGFDINVPISGWRRTVQAPIAYLCRALLFVMGFYWIETTGRSAKPEEARLIACAPHSTVLDAFYLYYAFNCPSGIGKKEALDYPFSGVFARALQTVAVDRNTAEGKKQALVTLKERALDPREKRQFMAFCEGTCHNRLQFIELKKGLFTPGIPVQGVVLEFPHVSFDPTWSSAGPSRAFMIYWLLCQFWNRMRVNFLPVYIPNDEEKQNAILFASNLRTKMAEAVGNIPVTNHSYGDMFLAKAAKKRGVSPNALRFELATLKDKFQLEEPFARDMLLAYRKAFLKDVVVLSQQQMANALGVVNGKPLEKVFNAMKDLDRNKVDFACLLVASSQILKVLTENDMELIWNEIAGEKTGLDLEQVERILLEFFLIGSKKRSLYLAMTQGAQSLTKEKLLGYLKSRPIMALVVVESLLFGRAKLATDV